MKARTKNILRGIGSLMDIFPRSEFSRYISHKDSEERMSEHWQRVGDSFRRVMGDFQHEPTTGQRSSDLAK